MSVEIEDNTEEILTMMEQAQKKALTECGMMAEGYAKALCPTDTGLLKNSITYALDGEAVKTPNYKANRGKKLRNGKRSSEIQIGETYAGQMPQEGEDCTRSVYVGTNVKYAIYVENGTGGDRKKGPRPFIKTAVTGHIEEYRKIIKSNLDAYN